MSRPAHDPANAPAVEVARDLPHGGFCLILAASLGVLSFLLQGHVGFNAQDESFLWYGVIRTNAGELPLRDFRAYDPGRYLWCAGFATVLGDGLVAVRAAATAFAAIGLACGLLAARRVVAGRPALTGVGALLCVWLFPPWKQFECAVSLAAVLLAVRVAERPSRGRILAVGVGVGLAAFFGRNLGLYAGLGSASLVLWLAWKRGFPGLARDLGVLAAGAALGYAPMLALCLCANGYWAAFADSVRFYVTQRTLNAELPVPWPWTVEFAGRSASAIARGLTVGTLFLLVPLVYGASLVRLLARRREDPRAVALLAGATFVGVFFAHHASVRSDVYHLAESGHPFLLASLALPVALWTDRARRAVLVALSALLLASWWSVLPMQPLTQELQARGAAAWVEAPIGGDVLTLPRGDAAALADTRALVEAQAQPADEVWIGPQFLGLYPILGRRSPVWDIYPAWPASEALQQRMIRELDGTQLVLQDRRPLGRDENLAFPRTHPLVWRWITQRFEPVAVPGLPQELVLLRRKAR